MVRTLSLVIIHPSCFFADPLTCEIAGDACVTIGIPCGQPNTIVSCEDSAKQCCSSSGKHCIRVHHDDVIKWKHFRVSGPFWGEFTITGEFPSQRPVTRSFDVLFDLRLNKRLGKQSRHWLKTRIICIGVSAIMIGCFCCVRCRGLTTCPPYIVPLGGKPIRNDLIWKFGVM